MRFLELAHLLRGWHSQMLYITWLQCKRELYNFPQSGAVQKDAYYMRTPWGDPEQANAYHLHTLQGHFCFFAKYTGCQQKRQRLGLVPHSRGQDRASLPSSAVTGEEGAVSPQPARETQPKSQPPHCKSDFLPANNSSEETLKETALTAFSCSSCVFTCGFPPLLLAFSWCLVFLTFLLWIEE